MGINELIKREYVWKNSEVQSKDEVFELVSKQALKDGFVKESFCNGLKDREKNFPTGLQLEKYGVAIPHTDSEHVNEEFIALVFPEEPISFNRMDNSNEKVDVNLIFILAIKSSEDHMSTLSHLMTVIQDQGVMEKLLLSKDEQEVIEIMKGEK